jgi:hypothetical protein
MISFIWIFTFLNRWWEDKIFWTKWSQASAEFNMLLVLNFLPSFRSTNLSHLRRIYDFIFLLWLSFCYCFFKLSGAQIWT